MSTRNLLVVATAPIDGSLLRKHVQEYEANARVRIVAPASDVSPLQWLASDEDEARAEAEEIARRAGEAVAEPAVSVETEVGDTDPVQAIEDALRTFEADELLIVTRTGEDAGWLEESSAEEALERFGLPIKHLAVEGR